MIYYTIIYLNDSEYFFVAYMNECQISLTFLPAAGREDGVDYSVSLSFIEVYKEVGYDLLSKARREIRATSWSWISLSIPVIQVGLGEKVDLKCYQTLSAVCETCFQNGNIFLPPAFFGSFWKSLCCVVKLPVSYVLAQDFGRNQAGAGSWKCFASVSLYNFVMQTDPQFSLLHFMVQPTI